MARNHSPSGPERIKALIRERGHTYVTLAAEVGVTPQAIYAIVNGQSRGATARYALAKALGADVLDLWPEDSVPTAA